MPLCVKVSCPLSVWRCHLCLPPPRLLARPPWNWMRPPPPARKPAPGCSWHCRSGPAGAAGRSTCPQPLPALEAPHGGTDALCYTPCSLSSCHRGWACCPSSVCLLAPGVCQDKPRWLLIADALPCTSVSPPRVRRSWKTMAYGAHGVGHTGLGQRQGEGLRSQNVTAGGAPGIFTSWGLNTGHRGNHRC